MASKGFASKAQQVKLENLVKTGKMSQINYDSMVSATPIGAELPERIGVAKIPSPSENKFDLSKILNREID